MIYLVSNFGKSRLAEGAAIAATSLVLPAGHGDKFPTPTTGQGFWVLVGSPTQQPELRLCTHRSGDVLTVEALTKDWGIGTSVINPVNAELLESFVQRQELNSLITWGSGDDADRILINGVATGPHLTGPRGLDGATGGGIAGITGADTKPSTPSQWDDEFDATELSAIWSTGPTIMDGEGGHTTVTNYTIDTTWRGWLRVLLDSSSSSLVIRQPFTPIQSNGISITVKCSIELAAVYQTMSILLMNSSFSDGFRFSLEFGSLGGRLCIHTKDSDTWNYNRVAGSIALLLGTYYIHVQTTASAPNTYSVYWSLNGQTWTLIGSYAKTVTLAYLSLKLSSGGSTRKQWAGLDFVRVNSIFLP